MDTRIKEQRRCKGVKVTGRINQRITGAEEKKINLQVSYRTPGGIRSRTGALNNTEARLS